MDATSISFAYAEIELDDEPDGLRNLPNNWRQPHAINIVLNPQHRRFNKLKRMKPQRFCFDPRLWKRQ
jgi:hypothetical protein